MSPYLAMMAIFGISGTGSHGSQKAAIFDSFGFFAVLQYINFTVFWAKMRWHLEFYRYLCEIIHLCVWTRYRGSARWALLQENSESTQPFLRTILRKTTWVVWLFSFLIAIKVRFITQTKWQTVQCQFFAESKKKTILGRVCWWRIWRPHWKTNTMKRCSFGK